MLSCIFKFCLYFSLRKLLLSETPAINFHSRGFRCLFMFNHSHVWCLQFIFFTARKTKLREGNVFTGVCLSTGGSSAFPPCYLHSTIPHPELYPGDCTPRTPPPGTQKRAVSILLECFLVVE